MLLFAPRLFRLRAFGATTKREKIAQKLNLTPPMDELTAYKIEKSLKTLRRETRVRHFIAYSKRVGELGQNTARTGGKEQMNLE